MGTRALQDVGSPTLPGGPYRACLFDLDGVLTDTASVHDRAWKATFDAFLASWSDRTGTPQSPFDAITDYDDYVDGRPRIDGVRSFLASRNIEMPDGQPEDAPGTETVWGLANAKNRRLLALIADGGVRPYPGSVRFLRSVRAAGLRTAVVSSSANCAAVVAAAGLEALLDERVDGLDLASGRLSGKPAPDSFLEAAHRLCVAPGETIVVEDALAGVEAGRAGRFGLVIGVDRVGQAAALTAHGADVVVSDLAELVAPA